MMDVCEECGKQDFEEATGYLVCRECNTVLRGYVETVVEFGLPHGRSGSAPRSRNQRRNPARQEAKDQGWNYYDAFSMILLKQTDAVLECGSECFNKLTPEQRSEGVNPVSVIGTKENVKNCIRVLYSNYMGKIAKISKPIETEAEVASNMTARAEEPSIIPEWLLPTEETKKPEKTDTFIFAPPKAPLKKRKKAKSTVENLVDVPEEELTILQSRKKKKQIQDAFMKLALHGVETDAEAAKAFVEAERQAQAQEEEAERPVQQTRLSTIKHLVPQCFPEGKTTTEILAMKKTKNVPRLKGVLSDPEYLTLYKCVSFIHAALLMKCVPIYYSDIIRWIREGHVPLKGAHLLLPKYMKLTHADSLVLGGVSCNRSKGYPKPKTLRTNTSKLLKFLDITNISRPPVSCLAAKILKDLQLPRKISACVDALDLLVQRRSSVVKDNEMGAMIDHGNVYAAGLILIVMKILLGLDDVTEVEMSKAAEKINELRGAKPSSGLNKREGWNDDAVETCFVWTEWKAYIEFRRETFARVSVPHAVKDGVVHLMNPNYVLQYASSRGFKPTHKGKRGKKGKKSYKDAELFAFFEQAGKQFAPHDHPIDRFPTFRPTRFPSHGLAEQLIEFDSVQFALLKQTFQMSSLKFASCPDTLVEPLNKSATPHRLDVVEGSALKELRMSLPFLASTTKMSKRTQQFQRHTVQNVPNDPPVVAAPEEDGGQRARPTLVIHKPSRGYWIREVFAKMSKKDWVQFKTTLPRSFVFILNLICEHLDEKPSEVYSKFLYLEQIIFLKDCNVNQTTMPDEELRHRYRSALRARL